MPDKRGVKNKLSGAQRAQIAEMVENGVSDEDIARAYGVHRTTILRIRHDLECGSAENSEPEIGTLRHLIWRTRVEKTLLDESYAADQRGDIERRDALWDEVFEFRAQYAPKDLFVTLGKAEP